VPARGRRLRRCGARPEAAAGVGRPKGALKGGGVQLPKRWDHLSRAQANVTVIPAQAPGPSPLAKKMLFPLLQTMSRSATSTRVVNPSRDGDPTTSLGSLFQCLTTLSVKTFFLISNLNLPRRSLRPLPLVLSLVTWERRPAPASRRPPFRLLPPRTWLCAASRPSSVGPEAVSADAAPLWHVQAPARSNLMVSKPCPWSSPPLASVVPASKPPAPSGSAFQTPSHWQVKPPQALDHPSSSRTGAASLVISTLGLP